MDRRHVITGMSAVATAAAASRPASAQDWPARNVTLVLPRVAGCTIDATARLFAQHLSRVLPNRVVIARGRTPSAGCASGASSE